MQGHALFPDPTPPPSSPSLFPPYPSPRPTGALEQKKTKAVHKPQLSPFLWLKFLLAPQPLVEQDVVAASIDAELTAPMGVLPETNFEGLSELAATVSDGTCGGRAFLGAETEDLDDSEPRFFPPEVDFFGGDIVLKPDPGADTVSHWEQLAGGDDPDVTMFPVSCLFGGCPRRFDKTKTMRAHVKQSHRACSTAFVSKLSAAKPRNTNKKGTAIVLGRTRYDRRVSRTRAVAQAHDRDAANADATDLQFSCTICLKRFAKNSTAVAHQRRAHREERPYGCTVCGKTFVSPKRVSSHARIHTTRHPQHECAFCDKLFMTIQLCASHEVTHTGERAFGCDHCPMRFGQRGTATRHQRIHSGDKPFGCPSCEKRFNQSGAAKRHERIHAPKHARINKPNAVKTPATATAT